MSFDNLGGRRFFLAFITGLGTFVLTWYSKIDAATYSMVTIAVVGALIAGHTTENVKGITAAK